MGLFGKKQEIEEIEKQDDNLEDGEKIKIEIKPKEKFEIHEYFTTKYNYPESVIDLIAFKEKFLDFIYQKELKKKEKEGEKINKTNFKEKIHDEFGNIFEIVMLHRTGLNIALYDISDIKRIRKYLLPFIKEFIKEKNIEILKNYYQALADAGFNVEEDYLNDPDKLRQVAELTAELTKPKETQNKNLSSEGERIKNILQKPIEIVYNFNIGYIYLSRQFFVDLKSQINEIYKNELEIMEKLGTGGELGIDGYLKKIEEKFQNGDYDERDLIEEGEKFVDVVLNILVKRYGASDIFFLPYSGTDRPTGRILYKSLGKAKLFIDDIPGSFFIRLVRIIGLKANFEIKNDQYQYSGVIQSFPIDATRRVNFRTEVFQVLSKTHLGGPMPFAVLRTLEGGKSKTLEELNYTEEFISAVRTVTKTNKQGIIIVSGPTGSGKSTLLYAVISEYSVTIPDRLIYSIENPVEKDLNLWNFGQMEVDPQRGMEFKIALKSLMRMAPDVIFIGEIRDKETALAALEAANTGHLVFATLHVNNSVEIAGRLEDLIKDKSKIKELKTSLKGAIAQRLLPELCPNCMQIEEDVEKFPEDLQKMKGVNYFNELKDLQKLYLTGTGCSKCKGMGTIGRIPVVEIISYNKVINNKKELYLYLKHTINFKSMFWYAVEQMKAGKKVDYRDVIALYDPVTDINNIDPEYISD